MQEFGKELGSAIRRQRKLLKLSQEELGRFAGCGALFIHELEKGKATVRLDKVIDVIKVLGLQFTLERGKTGLTTKGL